MKQRFKMMDEVLGVLPCETFTNAKQTEPRREHSPSNVTKDWLRTTTTKAIAGGPGLKVQYTPSKMKSTCVIYVQITCFVSSHTWFNQCQQP